MATDFQEVEQALLEHFEPFSDRLHHVILDPVMDHLQEMTTSTWSGVQITVVGRNVLKQLLDFKAPLIIVQAPFRAPSMPSLVPDVKEIDKLFFEAISASHRLFIVRVTLVDDDVTRGESFI